MADQADNLTRAEYDRFLAWCKSEMARADLVHRQMKAIGSDPVTVARIGLDCSALTVVALKLERMKKGAQT